MSETSVTVLGLGRMGAAMATALAADGWSVTAWNRSPAPAPAGTTLAEEVTEAVAGADVVLLCLFDADACRAVLDRCADALAPGTLVVNTATVGPDEAEALAQRVREAGARPVHAPVLGSVPAVRAGRLVVLAGGPEADVEEARPLLDVLSHDVRHVGDPARAAALKLVGNASLAGAVVELGEVLTAADALGIGRDEALDVLATGQLGTLVTMKRDRLTGGEQPDADFAVGALDKDLRLLGAASGADLHAARTIGGLLGAGRVRPDEDIAAVCVAGEGAAAPDEVVAPLAVYARGHATGDPSHFREAFLPTAHIEGLREGRFTSWDLEEYCGLFGGVPADDEAERRRTVDRVEVHGTVATATMTLHHGADVFTDVFLLIDGPDGWRIANKVYDRRAR